MESETNDSVILIGNIRGYQSTNFEITKVNDYFTNKHIKITDSKLNKYFTDIYTDYEIMILNKYIVNSIDGYTPESINHIKTYLTDSYDAIKSILQDSSVSNINIKLKTK